MLQTQVLPSVAAWDCHCLHCQCAIEPGLASGLCVECYLDAVMGDGWFELEPGDGDSVCCLCGRLFEPEYDRQAVCNGGDCDVRDWPEPDDDGPLGVPCPGDDFVPF
jgi:hypothetical protein